MPKTRPGTVFVVLPLLANLVLGACGSTRVFHADFNADVIGNRPATSPPTNPTGDEIGMSSSSVGGQFVVVNSTELGSRALQYANVPVDPNARFLLFVSAPISPASTNELWAMWDGVPNLTARDSPLDVWLGNNHFQETVRLRFKDGKISVQTPGGGLNFEEIGTYTRGRVHSIILSLNKANQT